MPESYFGTPVRLHQPLEEGITQLSRSFLQGKTFLAAILFHVLLFHGPGQTQRVGRISHELRVAVRFGPPKPMMEVGDMKGGRMGRPEGVQNVQQGHRIRSAGNGDENLLSGPEHPVLPDGPKGFPEQRLPHFRRLSGHCVTVL
jgi:hypothetical protein